MRNERDWPLLLAGRIAAVGRRQHPPIFLEAQSFGYVAAQLPSPATMLIDHKTRTFFRNLRQSAAQSATRTNGGAGPGVRHGERRLRVGLRIVVAVDPAADTRLDTVLDAAVDPRQWLDALRLCLALAGFASCRVCHATCSHWAGLRLGLRRLALIGREHVAPRRALDLRRGRRRARQASGEQQGLARHADSGDCGPHRAGDSCTRSI